MNRTLSMKAGERYGRLLSAEFAGRDKRRRSLWRFVCDCGESVVLSTNSVRIGNTQSCGCLRKEAIGNLNKKHGMKDRSEYKIWKAIRARCNCITDAAYPNYGGRGIKLCERWNDFLTFLRDMGPRPAGSSIERVDNSRGYSPENCIWADRKTQARNKRNNAIVEFQGREMCLAEAVELAGAEYKTAWTRIFRHGWSVERALTEPVRA